MLKRKIETKIKDWLANSNKALMVEGAKGVGKSFTIRETLKESGLDYFEINLVKDKDSLNLLKHFHNNPSEFFDYITLIANKTLKEGSVIFLDEVQEYKEIVTAIKFLVENGKYKFILSGSLLGVEIFDLKSAPVGYLDTIKMYPLDFEEFVINNNVPKELMDRLESCYKTLTPVTSSLHEKMMTLFRIYLIIGGMPDAVNQYLQYKDFNKVDNVHKNIIEQYKKDFTKYDSKDKLYLNHIYSQIPSQIADNNKRFNLSCLTQNARLSKYQNGLNWLIDAGVAISVFNLTETRLPLQIKKKETLFKFFMSDVGLLTSCYGNSTKLGILQDSVNLNAGAIYENVVAQELIAHGYETFYYNSHKFGELDFVIEHEGSILPIEVKSGKDYKRHNALNNVLNNETFGIKKAYVFSIGNIEKEDKIIYLPIYMIMYLKEDNNIILPTINFDEEL